MLNVTAGVYQQQQCESEDIKLPLNESHWPITTTSDSRELV
jgi:hypothetical protein